MSAFVCTRVEHSIDSMFLAGLSGFAIFISLLGLFISLFMLLVPVIYEKYDKLIRLARAMKEVRVGFILGGAGLTLTFLIRLVSFAFATKFQPMT